MDCPLSLSIVIPAKNEAKSLTTLLPDITNRYPDAEVIVVDDGSTDNTEQLCNDLGIRRVAHPYSKGNGAAIKSGVRSASKEYIVFMDGDGQHDPADIEKLLYKIDEGFDMVVGARDERGQATKPRGLANRFYNWLSSKIVGQKIEDLTSGFRVVRRAYFSEFLYMLPNGFSYPTTSTMGFFRAGYSVAYTPVNVHKRIGDSHLHPLKDGIRFLLIIFKIATLYSPLKLFVPAAFLNAVTGVGYYIYTYTTMGRFTNMSAFLFISAVVIFFMGLLSEQVTTLLYQDKKK